MTRDVALQMLDSSQPHERLRAARFFSRNASAVDLRLLRKALMKESVSYIKRALEHAVQTRPDENEEVVQPDIEPNVPDNVRKELYTKAVEEVAGILMHEIAPIVGVLVDQVSRSLPQYDTSVAKQSLDRLVALLEAVAELKMAASAPRMQEFDFSMLVKTLAEATALDRISLQGPAPFVITGDPALLTLAISNGLRNASDAIAGREPTRNPAIVINWDESDVEYWLSILDFGPGVVGPTEGAFAIGTTNKHGHLGFGLAVARQAMNSLDGTVRLFNSGSAGAIFELRWCK